MISSNSSGVWKIALLRLPRNNVKEKAHLNHLSFKWLRWAAGRMRKRGGFEPPVHFHGHSISRLLHAVFPNFIPAYICSRMMLSSNDLRILFLHQCPLRSVSNPRVSHRVGDVLVTRFRGRLEPNFPYTTCPNHFFLPGLVHQFLWGASEHIIGKTHLPRSVAGLQSGYISEASGEVGIVPASDPSGGDDTATGKYRVRGIAESVVSATGLAGFDTHTVWHNVQQPPRSSRGLFFYLVGTLQRHG